MAKRINTNKREPSSNDWQDDYKLSEGDGKVKKAKIKITTGKLSDYTDGKLSSSKDSSDLGIEKKKKVIVPRAPREKGDTTEKAFQYYRDSYEKDPSPQRKSQLDDFLKKNKEYRDDLKLKRIRTK